MREPALEAAKTLDEHDEAAGPGQASGSGAAPALSGEVQAEIGKHLRALNDALVHEALPETMAEQLRSLDRAARIARLRQRLSQGR